MYNLTRLLVWFFLLLVFFAGIGFSFLNTTPVPLSLGVWTFSPQPVAIWVVAAFALGGFLGLLIGSGLGRLLKRGHVNRQMHTQAESGNDTSLDPQYLSSRETE